ncbi:MAG: substrate-binding domain-containing protein [Spirochaetales bacterium]|uniref:Substrate-binding domain-containing protein n=1 Tax=Candidatus Thalassospirochaeta sargassi TaxID=3119039 RepID=A0AAJ1MJB4_9SPIO|nr:substrate-binding domain-containing protein [Spirochaetales bacterium]
MIGKTPLSKSTAVIFLILTLFSACSASDSRQVKSSAEAESKSLIKNTQFENNKRTFAIVFPLLHPFFAETNRGAKEMADNIGVNLILVGPHHYSVEEQIQMMEQLIEKSVDGIGIGPFDPVALNPVIDKAVDSGINVICFDTDAPESRRLSFISTDNFKQGMHLGEITAKFLNGKGKIIISQGVPTQLNLNQRLEGVRTHLDGYPGIEILAVKSGYGNHDQTIASIEDMIDEHPDFDALIGLDAQAGPSAVVVWKARGLSQHLIVSEDMPETIKGIRDNVVTATITQEQYRWGKLIVERLDEASKGINLKTTETTDTRLIVNENVNSYYPDNY